MIFAVDFDGVVHDHKHPLPGRRMGAPIEGAREALTKYKSRGNRIVIFSSWANERGQKVISDWLKYYEIPYSEITNIKIDADVYLDDKAVRFTSWAEFEGQFP